MDVIEPLPQEDSRSYADRVGKAMADELGA